MQVLFDGANMLASDVKCFSFNGATPVIQHVTDRFGLRKRDTFYRKDSADDSWHPLRAKLDWSAPEPDLRRHLSSSLLDRAEAVCSAVTAAGTGLDFARVDLLYSASQDKLLLGEVTPYPGGGRHHFSGTPDLDVALGKEWCMWAGGPGFA